MSKSYHRLDKNNALVALAIGSTMGAEFVPPCLQSYFVETWIAILGT